MIFALAYYRISSILQPSVIFLTICFLGTAFSSYQYLEISYLSGLKNPGRRIGVTSAMYIPDLWWLIIDISMKDQVCTLEFDRHCRAAHKHLRCKPKTREELLIVEHARFHGIGQR